MSATTSTRRVVINDCYGWFGLSSAGEAAYLARQGKTATFYVEDRASGAKPGKRDYLRTADPETDGVLGWTTLTEDIGERVSHETMWPGGNGNAAYWSGHALKRDDPDLIAIVESNPKSASGRFAALKVVEIPADAEWLIEEYDGVEWVSEAHRTWR